HVKTAALVGLIVGLLAVTSVLSPPIASGLSELGFTFRFSRVYNRVFEVLLVAGLALGWRRLDLGGPDAWGLRRAGWGRDLRVGLAIGVAGITLALLVAW